MPTATPEQTEPLWLLDGTAAIGCVEGELRQSGAGLVEGESTAQRVVATEHRLAPIARFQRVRFLFETNQLHMKHGSVWDSAMAKLVSIWP